MVKNWVMAQLVSLKGDFNDKQTPTPCCSNTYAHLNTILHYLELTRPKIPNIEFCFKGTLGFL